jgi:predicted transcriptional regulator
MSSSTFTVRVDSALKNRLEKLAKSTGRSRSFLAAEAIGEYVEVNEWQVAGIKRAMQSVERDGDIPHEEVKKWVRSLGSGQGHRMPKPRKP